MPNFNYAINSSFQPFSMQELLVPLTLYKDAYEKDEERYLELQQKAGDLSAAIQALPEDSNVRKQYEKYYNELEQQAKDFSNNGKTYRTSKGLLDLRRRYQGEVGTINRANETLQNIIKLRQTQLAQDPTIMYKNENINLDTIFNNPNYMDWSISGNYLSAEGAKMGEALSKRQFSTEEGKTNILGGAYIDFISRTGVQDTESFKRSPEFKRAAMQDLASKGVYANLSGANLQRAIDSYMSGVDKGIVYSETHNPTRDIRVPDWNGLEGKREFDLNYKLKLDELAEEKAYHEATLATKANKKSGSKSSSEYQTQGANRVKISWKGDNPNDTNGDADDDIEVKNVAEDEESHPGKIYNYDDLPTYAKNKVDKLVGDGSVDYYDYYFKPYSGGIFNDDEAELELVPKKVIKGNKRTDEDELDYNLN